jgi:hypothetical protein
MPSHLNKSNGSHLRRARLSRGKVPCKISAARPPEQKKDDENEFTAFLSRIAWQFGEYFEKEDLVVRAD